MRLLLATTSLLALCPLVFAKGALAQASLPTTQINNCFTLIHDCAKRDSDGSVVQNSYPTLSEVDVDPYFGGYGTLGLLEYYRATKSTTALTDVTKWLTWCAGTTRRDGVYYGPDAQTSTEYAQNLPSSLRYCNFLWRYHGAPGQTKNMQLQYADSVDSYAALVLMNLGRLTEVSTADYKKYKPLADNAVLAIQLCQKRQAGESTDDQLTVARPTYRIKYLIDNIEVLQGLIEAQKYYAAIGQSSSPAAMAVSTIIQQNTANMYRFYASGPKRFVYVVDMLEKQQSAATLPYDGLANLFALAHIDGTPSPSVEWNYANKFPRDAYTEGAKAVPTGRWLMASRPLGATYETREYSRLLQEVNATTQLNNRVHYPGTALLAIYGYFDPSKRLPSIAYTAPSTKALPGSGNSTQVASSSSSQRLGVG